MIFIFMKTLTIETYCGQTLSFTAPMVVNSKKGHRLWIESIEGVFTVYWDNVKTIKSEHL